MEKKLIKNKRAPCSVARFLDRIPSFPYIRPTVPAKIKAFQAKKKDRN
jgi:hypothetical protein